MLVDGPSPPFGLCLTCLPFRAALNLHAGTVKGTNYPEHFAVPRHANQPLIVPNAHLLPSARPIRTVIVPASGAAQLHVMTTVSDGVRRPATVVPVFDGPPTASAIIVKL